MARPKSDPVQRFMKFVKLCESGCWEWQGAKGRGGYGKFQWDGTTTMQAHRAGYQLLDGSIPDGLHLLHSCDNRVCVNPKHLTPGKAIDNIRDMDAKGRRGTKSKLTLGDRTRILALLDGGASQELIGKAFGVDQTTVSRIKLHKTKLFRKE